MQKEEASNERARSGKDSRHHGRPQPLRSNECAIPGWTRLRQGHDHGERPAQFNLESSRSLAIFRWEKNCTLFATVTGICDTPEEQHRWPSWWCLLRESPIDEWTRWRCVVMYWSRRWFYVLDWDVMSMLTLVGGECVWSMKDRVVRLAFSLADSHNVAKEPWVLSTKQIAQF